MTDIHQVAADIVRQRKERIRPVERALGEVEACAAALRAFESASVDTAATCPAELRAAVEALPVRQALMDAAEAERRLRVAVARLSRDGVTIGVAGMAGQGKSTLLQALSGLPDETIPAQAGKFCTAARCEIRNADHTRAAIRFHTENGFLRDVVGPYFDELGLQPKPVRLDDFLTRPLPPLDDAKATPDQRTYYQRLAHMRDQTASVRSLMTGAETPIPLSEIRDYVTHGTEAAPSCKYLAVEKAIVETKFPHTDMPPGLRLVDLPGLGEMSPVIAHALKKSVAEEVDLMLMVRRPDHLRAGWQGFDSAPFTLMESVVGREPPFAQWLAVVLNRTDDNANSVRLMTADRKDYLHGARLWEADCRNAEEVRNAVVHPAMALLTEVPGALDRGVVNAARESVGRIGDVLASPLEAVSRALEDGQSGLDGDDDPSELQRSFLADLRHHMRVLLGTLGTDRDGADTEVLAGIPSLGQSMRTMDADFDRALAADRLPDGYAPWDVARLTRELELHSGAKGTLEEASTNTRVALSLYFAHRVAPLFNAMVNEVKTRVAREIAGTDPMPRLFSAWKLSPKVDASFFSVVAEKLGALGGAPTLRAAFDRLARWSIEYDDCFLPLVRHRLARFDPADKTAFEGPDGMGRWRFEGSGTDYAGMAAQMRAALDTAASEVVASLKRPMATDDSLGKTILCVVEEFVDHILWRPDCEREWMRLMRANRHALFADHYAERDAAVATRQPWEERTASLVSAVQALRRFSEET